MHDHLELSNLSERLPGFVAWREQTVPGLESPLWDMVPCLEGRWRFGGAGLAGGPAPVTRAFAVQSENKYMKAVLWSSQKHLLFTC